METPFKRVFGQDADNNAIVLEACFPLPDDGITTNCLVFRIRLDDAYSTNAEVTVIGRTSVKDTKISTSSCPVSCLGNILHRSHRIVMRPTLEDW